MKIIIILKLCLCSVRATCVRRTKMCVAELTRLVLYIIFGRYRPLHSKASVTDDSTTSFIVWVLGYVCMYIVYPYSE